MKIIPPRYSVSALEKVSKNSAGLLFMRSDIQTELRTSIGAVWGPFFHLYSTLHFHRSLLGVIPRLEGGNETRSGSSRAGCPLS